MKAVRIIEPGRVELVEEPIPEVGEDQVLCRVVNVGICGTDYNIFRGEFEERVDFPLRPGHEWSGVVEKVGSHVTLFKPGDRVVGETAVACGVCEDCIKHVRASCKNILSVGTVHAWPGAMCEYELYPAGDLKKLPDSISFEHAALIEPAGNAISGIINGGVTFGSSVCIMGTGPIGVAAAAIARAYGASTVISVGRSDFKLDLCKKLGATHTVNTAHDDPLEAIMDATGGKGVDVALEISGSKQLFETCLKGAKLHGDIETVAFYEGTYDFDITDFAFKGLTLKAAGFGGLGYFDYVMQLMEQGLIDLTPMITHRCTLDEIPEQIRSFKVDNANKIKVMACMG